MNSVGFRRLAAKVLFTSALAVGCIWYLADAASQSTNAANLLLILPAALITVALCVAVIVEDVVTWRRASHAGGAAAWTERLDWRVPVLMALVGLYVLAVVTVGLADLATFVFVAVSLVLLNERRPWAVVTYSVAFTVAVVGGLKVMLSYDVPTLLF
jgi:hypothetical protein